MASGFSAADAQGDFSRARRARLLADIGRRLRREPDDVGLILPFEEVVDALGRISENDLGLQTIPLDSIVGTVDRSRRDFDRSFRPTSHRVRRRWQGIATAMRRGSDMPPIEDGVPKLVVDLTSTTFIDSSSLGVLIGAHRRLKQRDGSLVVVCDNEAIVKTFKITGLDGVFTLVPSLDDALDGDAVGAGP